MSRNDFRRRQAQRQRRKLVRHLPIILALFLAFSALAAGVFAQTPFVSVQPKQPPKIRHSLSLPRPLAHLLRPHISLRAMTTTVPLLSLKKTPLWQKTPLPWKRSHLMRKQRLLSYQLMCRTFPMYFSILLSWTLPKPLTATAGLPATIPS